MSFDSSAMPWVRMPTVYGEFSARVFSVRNEEHLVLRRGDPATPGVLVRIHSECLTGDALFSRRCDCGPQLARSLELLGQARAGVLVYLRGQEGRGIGLRAKLAAYALQDQGLDTVDANLHLGLPVDARSYEGVVEILTTLGVRRLRLLTNNPDKIRQLEQPPLEIVERVALQVAVDEEHRTYLETKRQRLGHWLDL